MLLLPSFIIKIITPLIFISGLPVAPMSLHPLHVTTTEFNFNSKEKSVEISISIFTDDFENALKKKYNQKIDLTNPAMHKKMGELVKNYIESHLGCKINGKGISINYLGFEIDVEATNAYFEVQGVTKLSNLETNNTLLYDLFDDQISIIHVTNGLARKSTKLAYPEQSFKAIF